MPERIPVFLIDRAPLFRQCLATVLRRVRSIEIVGDAGTAADGLAQLPGARAHVVVVDPDVADGGPELVAQLQEQSPETAVLVLTSPGSKRGSVTEMIESGARGYLEKDCDVRTLVQCIERVHDGEVVIASRNADGLSKDLVAAGAEASSLTQREVEVIRLVAEGRTNAEIARHLFISEHTAKSHLAKMLGKLGFANRAQLATHANQLGLLDSPTDRPRP